MKVLHLLSLSLILLFQGCATHVDGLQHDESFNYASVKKGGIAIGGVTTTSTPLSLTERNKYAELFLSEVRDERKDYRVSSAGLIANKLGSSYDQILNEYRMSNEVSPTSIQALQGAGISERYIAFARIEQNETSEDKEEGSVENYDSKGKLKGTTITISYKGIRKIVISAKIFDLQQNRTIWSGNVTKVLENEKNDSFPGRSGKKRLGDILLEELLKDEVVYPKAPDLYEGLSAAFTGIAENLPKAK